MTTTKVIELVGESEKSWEDAAHNAVAEAGKTLEGISGIEILNMTASIEKGKITEYKVNLHVAFPVLND